MYKIKAGGLRWLKGFHLVAVSCWVGGGIALLLMYFLKIDISNGDVLYGVNRSIHHVDMAVVVIPGAFGCLLTGLIYSGLSNWGFFKQKWLIFKWIITVSAILFGTFYLGPWETKMMEISGELGIAALNDESYLYYQKMNLFFGSGQVLLLIVTVFVSVFKPWRKR
ncbi:MAG: DUF2269 family protein [Desulfocapsaceae bacterium]|jgi:uncharacterized membrane protein|nr:DUF2269 family protein [Desulfocapsaceae bacterium]